MTATRDILAFAAGAHSLPPAAAAAARHLLGDTLAVGGAGAASPEAEKLSAALGFGSGPCRLIGRSETADAANAALWNGFSVHCLEWDAVHEPAVVHALSVVTAALHAVIDEAGGAEQEDALAALAVGVDIASGIGVAATGAMRFFRPATAGILGASLAAARIAGLPKERYPDVLGFAYSQAAGTMQAHVEASVALPLQIGLAARGAVTAVHLARAGMTAPHDVLEGPFGYAKLIEDLNLTKYDAGTRWLIEDVSVKPFPSGRASHGVLGELETLAQDLGLADVKAIDAAVPPLIHRLVARPWKPDMEESYARLCLPFLAPMMIRDGVIDPRKFTTRTFADPELSRLARNVRVEVDGNPDANALGPQRLHVELASGETIVREISASLGSPAAPMSDAQTRAKRDLARACAGAAAANAIYDDPLGYFCGAST